MYEIAKGILDEKRSYGAAVRLASQLATARREAAAKPNHDALQSDSVSWVLEWTTSGVTGKRVAWRGEGSRELPTGRDHSDWDRAFGRAAKLGM